MDHPVVEPGEPLQVQLDAQVQQARRGDVLGAPADRVALDGEHPPPEGVDPVGDPIRAPPRSERAEHALVGVVLRAARDPRRTVVVEPMRPPLGEGLLLLLFDSQARRRTPSRARGRRHCAGHEASAAKAASPPTAGGSASSSLPKRPGKSVVRVGLYQRAMQDRGFARKGAGNGGKAAAPPARSGVGPTTAWTVLAGVVELQPRTGVAAEGVVLGSGPMTHGP